MIKRFLSRLCSLRRDTEGASSIEFVVVFPAAMIIFLSTFEAGMYLTRQVFLDRGLDMAVRDIRLTTATPFSYEDLRSLICENATLIPDCENSIKIEMMRFDPYVGFTIPDTLDCVDRAETIQPVRQFEPGSENEMMFIRVCALFEPHFPSSVFAANMVGPHGELAMVTQSVYVTEPQG